MWGLSQFCPKVSQLSTCLSCTVHLQAASLSYQPALLLRGALSCHHARPEMARPSTQVLALVPTQSLYLLCSHS